MGGGPQFAQQHRSTPPAQPQHSHFEDDDLVFGRLPHFPPVPLQKLLAGVQLPRRLLLGPEDFTELLPARAPTAVTPPPGTTELRVLGWSPGPSASAPHPGSEGRCHGGGRKLWLKTSSEQSGGKTTGSEKELIRNKQIDREGGKFAD